MPAGYTQGQLRVQLAEVMTEAARLALAQLDDRQDRDLPEYADNQVLLRIDNLGRIRFAPDLRWQVFTKENGGRCEYRSMSESHAQGVQVRNLASDLFSGFFTV